MSKLQQTVFRLETEFFDKWLETPRSRIKIDNKGFKQPDSDEWVHFQVLFGDSQNVKICGGGMTYRQAGTVQLYIYVPHDEGAQRAYELGDLFRSIFVNKTLDDIRLRSGFLGLPTKTSNWYEIRVSIPFEYDTQ